MPIESISILLADLLIRSQGTNNRSKVIMKITYSDYKLNNDTKSLKK